MRNNEDLQKDVQDAIKWEPLLNASEIGVVAKDGIITLTGIVDSYAKKIEAEVAAKNVVGVKAVVEKIEIKFDGLSEKRDDEIANEVLNALDCVASKEKIKIKVENGWVTLEGKLQWNYQKEATKKSVNNLTGIRGVSNNITIKSETHDKVEKIDIERALLRNWSINDRNIQVKVSGNTVTLIGTVVTSYQKDEAERIAWNAPGVLVVDNELVVD